MTKIKTYIPDTITCLNLLAGCVAVIMAFHAGERVGCLTGLQWFYVAVAAAALFDFCDGLAARTLNAYSPMGKELDSLSDLVSFGVAPAMMVLNLMNMHNGGCWLNYLSLLIAVGGALRLARFNVDDTQSTVFRGLPIPANAIFWVGMAAFCEKYGYAGDAVMAVAIVVMSLAMLVNVRMFSLKFKNLSIYDNVKRYGIIVAAVSFVVVYGISGLMWTVIMYMLVSFFTRNNPE